MRFLYQKFLGVLFFTWVVFNHSVIAAGGQSESGSLSADASVVVEHDHSLEIDFIKGRKLQISVNRLDVVKDIIKNYMDSHGQELVGVKTYLPALIQLWNADFNFARQQIIEQTDEKLDAILAKATEADFVRTKKLIDHRKKYRDSIVRNMDLVNDMVQKNRGMMSCGYLTFAWQLIVAALSVGGDAEFRRPPTWDRSLFTCHSFSDFILMAQLLYNDIIEGINHRFLGTFIPDITSMRPGNLVVPHVSKQGHLTIQTINDASVFKVNDALCAVNFVGVGTNPVLSYDSISVQDAEDTFSHDTIHWEIITNYGKVDQRHDMHELKMKLAEKYYETDVQYAWYVVFHENFYDIYEMDKKMSSTLIPKEMQKADVESLLKSKLVGDASEVNRQVEAFYSSGYEKIKAAYNR